MQIEKRSKYSEGENISSGKRSGTQPLSHMTTKYLIFGFGQLGKELLLKLNGQDLHVRSRNGLFGKFVQSNIDNYYIVNSSCEHENYNPMLSPLYKNIKHSGLSYDDEYESIYFAAGNTNVDKYDIVSYSEDCSMLEIAKKFKHKRFYFYSSDYIFDNARRYADHAPNENDIPNPLNKYGVSKLALENNVLTTCNNPVIIRTCWVYGGHSDDRNFYARIVNNRKPGDKVYANVDLLGNPTYAKDLARISVDDLANVDSGVYHVAGLERMTKYQFGKRIYKWHENKGLYNISDENLIAVQQDEEALVKRPKNGGLSTIKLNYKTLSLQEAMQDKHAEEIMNKVLDR